MNRRSCADWGEDISLLAAGSLSESARAEVESHLASCADCRKYYSELKSVAAPLANWGQNFAHLEPSPATQARWAAAIHAAKEPALVHRFAHLFSTVLRELIVPYRHVWTGLAAAWIAIITVNASSSSRIHPIEASASAVPAAEMRLAFEEQNRLLAELIGPVPTPLAEPPRRYDNQPHSERRSETATV